MPTCCDFLESLNHEQWDAQSLVRRVEGAATSLAHLLEAITIDASGAASRMLSEERLQLQQGDAPRRAGRRRHAHPSELVEGVPRSRGRPHDARRWRSRSIMLGDIVVHQQDCRRPLGMPRQIPEDRAARRCSSDAVKTQPILGNKKRIAGVQAGRDRHGLVVRRRPRGARYRRGVADGDERAQGRARRS